MTSSSETESFQIRNAFPSDADSIIAFNQAMARETEDRTLEDRIIRAGVQRILDEPDQGFYLVAENEEEIIGTLMVTREWSDWRNGDIWWIQSVYVHADHRRRGVFAGLYRHLQELAETAPGVVGLRLYVEVDNTPAQATYARLGMDDASYLVMQEIFG